MFWIISQIFHQFLSITFFDLKKTFKTVYNEKLFDVLRDNIIKWPWNLEKIIARKCIFSLLFFIFIDKLVAHFNSISAGITKTSSGDRACVKVNLNRAADAIYCRQYVLELNEKKCEHLIFNSLLTKFSNYNKKIVLTLNEKLNQISHI